MNTEQIRKAKQILRDAGYYVDSLWHVNDVTMDYECDDKTAYEILQNAMEWETESIFESISNLATQQYNLKEKQQ